MTAGPAGEKLAELREATREANAAIKDARTARRELAEAVQEFRRDADGWRKQLEDTYAQAMLEGVDKGLNEVTEFVRKCEKRLNARMDTIMMAITRPYQTDRGPLALDEIVTRQAAGENIVVNKTTRY